MDVQTAGAEERETGRLEAFSDGVFAIAMTLLALDLKVPHLASGAAVSSLLDALARQWPSYLAFITSFFTVLIMWVNHHGMFKLIHRVNGRLLFANGFLLMLTTTVPFTSELVSEYFQKPDAPVACAVYAGTFFLIAVGYNLTWLSAAHRRVLLKSDAPQRAVRRITQNYRLGLPLYLMATVVAFVSVRLSMGICTALWIFWAVTMWSA